MHLHSLAVIAQLTPSQLDLLRITYHAISLPDEVDDGFRPKFVISSDRAQADSVGVKWFDLLLKRMDYCVFETPFGAHYPHRKLDSLCRSFLNHHINGDEHPDLQIFDSFYFRGYYAMAHTDAHLPATHQLMLILDNGGHRLWSKAKDGTEIILTPQPGAVVLLSTHEQHALFPAARTRPNVCAERPLKLVALPFCLD